MPARNARKRKPAGKTTGQSVPFDTSKEVRAIARERVGTVKAGHVIVSKDQRKKPKHKGKGDLEADTGY